jgi:hypothetical protein
MLGSELHKTTLARLLASIDQPTAGAFTVGGIVASDMARTWVMLVDELGPTRLHSTPAPDHCRASI